MGHGSGGWKAKVRAPARAGPGGSPPRGSSPSPHRAGSRWRGARLRRRRSPHLEDPSSRSHRTPSLRPHALKPSPLGVGLGRTDLGRHKHSVPDRSFVSTVRVDAPCHIRASNLRCPAQSHVPSPTERCAPWSGLLDLWTGQPGCHSGGTNEKCLMKCHMEETRTSPDALEKAPPDVRFIRSHVPRKFCPPFLVPLFSAHGGV